LALLCLVAAAALTGCPTDKGTRSALTPTTTVVPATTAPTGPGGTGPGDSGSEPGRDPRVPEDAPPSLVLGGATPVALTPASVRLPRDRVLAGYGAGGVLVAAPADDEGAAVGPVDVIDPARGATVRRLSENGTVVAADGQRAVVLVDGGCVDDCSLLVAGPGA